MANVARSLRSIEADLEKAQERVARSARTTLTEACKCGELLLEAKEQMKHGEWGMWLERNFAGSDTTARNWMRLAQNTDTLPDPKSATIADLNVAEAIKHIAKPKPKSSGEQNGSAAAESALQTPATDAQPAKSPGDQSAPTPPSADPTPDQEQGNRGEAEPEQEPAPDPDSLEAAQANLDELKASVKETTKVARRVFQVKGQEIHAPWLGRFSWSGAIGQLNQYTRMLDDLRPVGGTRAKPKTKRDEKAKEALDK